jgi:hypothetical protein
MSCAEAWLAKINAVKAGFKSWDDIKLKYKSA